MCYFFHIHPLPQKRLTLIRALVGKQPGRLRSSLACKDLSSLSKPWERSTNITNAGGGVGHFSISSLKKKWRLEANMLQLTDHVPLVKVQTSCDLSRNFTLKTRSSSWGPPILWMLASPNSNDGFFGGYTFSASFKNAGIFVNIIDDI